MPQSVPAHLSSQTHRNAVATLAEMDRSRAAPLAPSSGAPAPHSSSAYISTALPQPLRLDVPLQPPSRLPAFQSTLDINGVDAMEVDQEPLYSSERRHLSPPTDDLSLTPEEEAERERQQSAVYESNFLRALAEMDLGGPLDGFEDDAAPAPDPLDELAEMEGKDLIVSFIGY